MKVIFYVIFLLLDLIIPELFLTTYKNEYVSSNQMQTTPNRKQYVYLFTIQEYSLLIKEETKNFYFK